MADTPITVGAKTRHGFTAVKKIPSQTNDATHVCLDPEAGRILLRHPSTGHEYTTVGSSTVQPHASGVNGFAGASDTAITLIQDSQ